LAPLAEEQPKIDGERLTWNVGYTRKQLKRVIYEKGRISIVTDLPIAGEKRLPPREACDQLFEMILHCDLSSNADVHNLAYWDQLPGVGANQYELLCKKNWDNPAAISRTEFDAAVCHIR
jgi:hypothetical protein